ncbi:hypothetical protein, partial [Streptomyces halstedii]|uniref:hypothetical protein n=1 Tax=Streptomyces halstedii TaxID=1944 RepID=UPI003364B219
GTGLVATARSGALFSGCPVASQIVPNQSMFTLAFHDRPARRRGHALRHRPRGRAGQGAAGPG